MCNKLHTTFRKSSLNVCDQHKSPPLSALCFQFTKKTKKQNQQSLFMPVSPVNVDSVGVSELHGSGWDIKHGGVKFLPFEGGAFHIPALLQHVMHLLWKENV